MFHLVLTIVLSASGQVAIDAGQGALDAGAAAYEADIQAAVADVKEIWPVSPELVKAVIEQESAWNPDAVSSAGAVGLMQVMPFNAEKVGIPVKELGQPKANIRAGTRLLAVLLEHYKGDMIGALAAYNARPRHLFAPLPMNGQTPRYVERVLANYRRYKAFSTARAGSGSPPERTPATQPTAVEPTWLQHN